MGKTPWNLAKKVGVSWNQGMAGNYPYPSGYKGQESPFQAIPTDQDIKDKIAHTQRMNNFEGHGVYLKRLNHIDMLYLISIKNEKGDPYGYKIGRTFLPIEKRYRWKMGFIQVIHTWQASHLVVFILEHLVLKMFSHFYKRGPENIEGRTECFSLDLPIEQLIDYVDESLPLLIEKIKHLKRI